VASLTAIEAVAPGLAQMRELGQEPGPAASAPALDRALSHAEHMRRVSDGVLEHVNEHDRDLLVVRQLAQGCHHVHRHLAPSSVVRPCIRRSDQVEQALVAARYLRTRRAAAHPVQAGVHDDPVEPGRHRRLAAEAVRPAERGDHRVLQRVGRVLGVGQSPERDSPQPVPVPEEELPERIRVTIDVQLEQLSIAHCRTRLSPTRAAPASRAA